MSSTSKHPAGSLLALALAIVGIMTFFAISLGKNTVQLLESTKNSDNQRKATVAVHNAQEYMRHTLKTKGAGYRELVTCNNQTFEGVLPGNGAFQALPEYCKMIFRNYGNKPGFFQNNDFSASIEIKGRSNTFEYFNAGLCGNFTANGTTKKCYSMPIPGQGNAGDNCNIYDPFPNDEATAANLLITHNGKPPGTGATGQQGPLNIPQVDHPCAWNKLQFGSSLTSRVAIPLYYTDSSGATINPFHEDSAERGGLAQATEFALRLRGQCKPFAERQDPNAFVGIGGTKDPNICLPIDRYELLEYGFEDELRDDPLVQWQITGFCENDEGDDEPCSIIANSQEYADGETNLNSELKAETIRDKQDEDFIVLNKYSYGLDTNSPVSTGLKIVLDNLSDPSNEVVLHKMKKPTLTLFLSSRIIADDDNDAQFGKRQLTYLEYQVLTDAPIGSPITKTISRFNFNGNLAVEELNHYQNVELVDFAINN